MQKSIHLASKGVQDLPTNFAFKNLVSHLKLEDKVTGGSSTAQGSLNSDEEPAPQLTCSHCEADTAISVCEECHDMLCRLCADHHKKYIKTRKHRLVEIGSQAVPEVSRKETDVQPNPKFTRFAHKPPFCDLPDHEENRVDMYCKSCDKVLCVKCAVTQHNGGNHDNDTATAIVGEYKDKLAQRSAETQDVQQKFERGIEEVRQTMASLEETEGMRAEAVLKQYGQIREELDRQRDDLLKKVKRISERKKARLTKQLEELMRVKTTLQEGTQLADDVRENCIAVEIMYIQSQIDARLQELCRDYGDYPCKPRENDIIDFAQSDSLKSIKEAIGRVTADPDPQNYTVDGIENVHFIEGKRSKLSITCRDIIGNKLDEHRHEVKASIQQVDQGDPIPCDVTNKGDGTYAITIQPQSHGRHQLTVSVNISGKSSERPPYYIMVSPPQPNITVATKEIRDDNMRNPWGIAVSQNDLIVVSDITTHCLLVFDKDGNFLRHIGNQGNKELEFESPRGLACTPTNHIIVAEKVNHRLQEVTLEGHFIRFFGTNEAGKQGSEPGKFYGPSGVAVNSEGIVFATDSLNQRIQYFKPDGTFIAVIGKWGSGLNGLNEPYGISIYNQPKVVGEGDRELLFVSERKGNRVQCFEMRGDAYQSVATFGKKGQNRGQLNEPAGILVDSNTGYLLITELKSHQISIFKRSGDFMCSFGNRQTHVEFRTPMSVATLGDSHVIVTDCENHCLKIFRCTS